MVKNFCGSIVVTLLHNIRKELTGLYFVKKNMTSLQNFIFHKVNNFITKEKILCTSNSKSRESTA